MCRRVYLMGACVWIFAIQPVSVRAEVPYQDQYLQVYVKMHDSENLEKAGDYAGALEGFKDCYARLLKIKQSDPTWEAALVGHRIDDCRVTIQRLQNEVGSQTTPTPPTSKPTPPPTPISPTPLPPSTSGTKAGNGNMSSDVIALQKRVQELESELNITKENLKNSRIEVDTYRTQLESVNTQLQAIKNKQSVDDKMGKLLAENKALTDKLTTAQKQIDALKSPNSKSKVALMQTQLKNLQDQLDESQASNKSYQTTITTLQQHLDAAQAELVADNQKLASLGPTNPEYATIKHENEVMRSILTREIQEQAHRDMAKRLYQEEFDNLKIKSKVLQEQLDILASPMTPATTDEERALLASMKAPEPGISTPPPEGTGNTLAMASTQTTNGGTTTVNSTTTGTSDPSVTGTSAATAQGTTTTTDTTTASGTSTATPTTGTDTTGTTTPTATTTTAATDTNTSPASATPPASSGNPPAVATPTTTPPQAPTETTIPPAQTTYTTTTVKQSANTPPAADPTQYSTKARLPDDMRDTAQQAADLFKNKRYDEAAGKYQTIIDKYPECLYAWSNLGVVRYQQGDLDDALKALQQAVKLSPTDSFSYANLGIVYYEMKQYENAIDALNQAKALDPKDAKVRNYLGCACSQKGWTEAAEKEFLKAIELDPDFGDAHFNLALVYATEKPPLIEMARKEYKKAQELGIGKDDRLEKLLGQSAASASASQP